jgi:Domain of unknown function (DUF5671)
VADDKLSSFLNLAKQRGVSDESLVGMLRQNGWPERRVYRALSEYYAELLGAAVPVREQGSGNARDAFLYLLNFITLGFWSVAVWQIWDHLVKRWFRDPLSLEVGSLRDDIAWQVAVIIVTFPIFLFVHRLIQQELTRRPELYYSPIRRWLTYLALVVAAITIVVDAALTIQSWITGNITVHFLLGTLGLFVLGGGIFAYYLTTMDPAKARS